MASVAPGNGDQHESDFRRFLKRHFTAIDLLKVVLSLASGYGIALLVKDTRIGTGVLALTLLTATSAFAIDRLRVRTEDELIDAIAATERQVSAELTDLQTQVSGHLTRLRDELDQHIDLVHAGVRFVPDAQGDETAGPGYDIATAAVRRAQSKIFVVGDYSPPEGEGATLLDPDNRSQYLDAIEEVLEHRLNASPRINGSLSYHRLIQRPPELYAEIARRSLNGVELSREDMAGDLQAFYHIERVLEIAKRSEQSGGNRIDVQIRLIPFLPNCPSMLLVDNRELQFTIPTRIDQSGDRFALQGLHGVLVMEDRASGAQVCNHFEAVFQRLKSKSLPIVRVLC